MSDSGYDKAVAMVGMKVHLVENVTFVGRKKELKKLKASLEGPQLTPVWIWGSRRMGKTSLSFRLSENSTFQTVRINCDVLEWKDMDHLADVLVQETNSQLGINLKKDGKVSLQELAKNGAGGERVILILDEFDRIAVCLEQNEQAFLRKILQESSFFSIVFISRVKPEQLLQDYSDESSRLLGICEVLRMPMLSSGDVSDLIRIVREICGITVPDWLAGWIYRRVGGYPICVQALLREYLLQCSLYSMPIPEDEMNRLNIFFVDASESYLEGLWKDLPYLIRNWLLKDVTALSGSLEREIAVLNLMEGDTPLKPLYLVDTGAKKGLVAQDEHLAEFIGLAERLNDAIKMCNEYSLRKGNPAVFQVTQQIFFIFEVARPVTNELVLNDRISKLHKICIESTNSDRLPKEDRCLIPRDIRQIYKKSDGFEVLVAWRNFCFHDASHDLEAHRGSDRYKNIGQICCKYLGPNRYKANSMADFNCIYKGILSEVVDSVERLMNALAEQNV
jgi:hypothetical protein